MEALIENLLNIVEETTKEADTNTNAFMEVVEELQLPTYKSDSDSNGIYIQNKKVGFYNNNYKIGKVEYGEALVINNNKLKDLLKSMGYNGTTETRAWGSKGYVGKNTEGKNSANIRPFGRCTILLLSKYNKLIGNTNNNTFVEVEGEIPFNNNDELQQRRNKRNKEEKVDDVF